MTLLRILIRPPTLEHLTLTPLPRDNRNKRSLPCALNAVQEDYTETENAIQQTALKPKDGCVEIAGTGLPRDQIIIKSSHQSQSGMYA